MLSDPAIFSPLSPASLKHKNPQRYKINASHRTQRLVKQYEDVFLEYPVCIISVVVVNDAY